MLNLLQTILILFFTSVAVKLNEKIVKAKRLFSNYLGQTTDETIFLSSTTPTEVESLINCIKPNKAIGPNSIPTKIFTVHKPVKWDSKKQNSKWDKVTATTSSAEIHIACSLMNKLLLLMIIMKKLDVFI